MRVLDSVETNAISGGQPPTKPPPMPQTMPMEEMFIETFETMADRVNEEYRRQEEARQLEEARRNPAFRLGESVAGVLVWLGVVR